MSSHRIAAFREFYDIPRAFVVTIPTGGLLFFDCPFDQSRDDYSDRYRVFALPGQLEDMPNDWRDVVTDRKNSLVCKLSTVDLTFDTTRRREVTVPEFESLFRDAERILAEHRLAQTTESPQS